MITMEFPTKDELAKRVKFLRELSVEKMGKGLAPSVSALYNMCAIFYGFPSWNHMSIKLNENVLAIEKLFLEELK